MITVDDATPLDGAAVDVAARVAWVLRMARTTAGLPETGLRQLARRLGTSTARLSRMETGQLRDGRLVDAYEEALGLPEGSLRAPVDIACRTFPDASPRDSDPGRVVDGVAELSRLTELLEGPEPAPGGAWLRWARAMSAPGNIGLPERHALPLLERLVSELARSVAHGYHTRYEALALIRCSAYGHLVLDIARTELARPHAHGLGDLMSAVGESTTPDAVDWCLDLLRRGTDREASLGALAIENMGQVGGDRFWADVLPSVVAAFDAAEPGTVAEEWAAHLVRLVPPGVWKGRGLVPARPLPPAPVAVRVSKHQADRRWRECLDAARAIGTETGVGDQPLLARLVHDIAFGPWATRAATSFMLLGAVPALAGRAAAHVARIAEDASDPRVRERAAQRLPGLLNGTDLPLLDRWLSHDDPALRRTAIAVAGSAGRHLPEDVLRRGVLDPATRRRALGAAGLSRHPSLAELAGSPDLPLDVREAAGWWLAAGGRVAG
jgi:hypothetical protein